MSERPKTRIEYLSGTDEKGRCHFDLFWPNPDPEDGRGPELGQGFFADPRVYGHPRPEDVEP
jgi:hypothetical protein